GANGIQALDLVGRKLPKDGGRAITAFFKKVGDYVKEREADEAMKPYVAPLGKALGDLQKATMWLMQNGMANPDNAGAASSDYMHLFGLVAIGYMWARIAEGAQARKVRDASQGPAMDAKLTTGKFYMERMLPETSLRLARINTGAATMMALPAEAF
ncbi:MAG: acyl-CoA dehydrogenase C-terminal domain-containing protein, partial [Rhodoblastus sp.]|nr:acyl-CoA dehydrogenase C-terminal domain-containing protein [Rhodoblastus sp.]